MIVAASTVAIVAIAAVVIVALFVLIYIVPRGDGAGRGVLGMGYGDRFEVSQGDPGLLERGVRLTDETG